MRYLLFIFCLVLAACGNTSKEAEKPTSEIQEKAKPAEVEVVKFSFLDSIEQSKEESSFIYHYPKRQVTKLLNQIELELSSEIIEAFSSCKDFEQLKLQKQFVLNNRYQLLVIQDNDAVYLSLWNKEENRCSDVLLSAQETDSSNLRGILIKRPEHYFLQLRKTQSISKDSIFTYAVKTYGFELISKKKSSVEIPLFQRADSIYRSEILSD